MRGSIKNGTKVSQDFKYNLVIVHDTYQPPLIMDIKKSGSGYMCTGAGFGQVGDYGNGSVRVESLDDLIIFELETA